MLKKSQRLRSLKEHGSSAATILAWYPRFNNEPPRPYLGNARRHRDALSQLGVRRLGLFGSVARGESRPGSDLDFVVTFESKTFDAYMDLLSFLEKLFEARVDLVLEEAIKPRWRSIILAEAVHVQGF